MHNFSQTTAGFGLRGPHVKELLSTLPDVDLLEVHSENFFGGGPAIEDLLTARLSYPVSLHGVGLSIGSTDEFDASHLKSLRSLIYKVEPALVSEHLSWGSVDGIYFNDLLPLPYTEEALDHFCARVAQVQEVLGREILIENPSSYLQYSHSTISEWEFLAAVSDRTGAGLLIDINNVYVSASNLGFDPVRYLRSLPGEKVGEIHLGGHAVKTFSAGELLIDDHGSPVCDAVWELYSYAINRWGNKPTIVEWDTNLPALSQLLLESELARICLERRRDVA